jgi:hypothetical protein
MIVARISDSPPHVSQVARVDALKYLVHFHQPLHCVSRKNGDGQFDHGANSMCVALREDPKRSKQRRGRERMVG